MLHLVIVTPSGDEERIQLDQDEYILGRDPHVSIPLRDRKVSRQHARIFRRGGSYFIEDLGSVNGVLAGGSPISGAKKLNPGLDLDIGGFILTVVAERPNGQLSFSFVGRSSPFENQEFILPVGELEVGRTDGNAIVLPDTSVSRQHALVTVAATGVVVEDLDSSNGCFVNGARIGRRTLRAGDRVRFGNVEFEFHVAGGAGSAARIGDIASRLTGGNRGAQVAIGLGALCIILLVVTLIVALGPGDTGSTEPRMSAWQVKYEKRIDLNLKQAEVFMRNAAWKDARSTYREVLDQDPINMAARDGLAEASANFEHSQLLAQARDALDSRKAKEALSIVRRVPTTARLAPEAKALEKQALNSLAEIATSRAKTACRRQEWQACHEAALEYISYEPRSLDLLSLIDQAEMAMKKAKIEFEAFERPEDVEDNVAIYTRYKEPDLRAAVSEYVKGDLAAAERRVAATQETGGAKNLMAKLSSFRREYEAGNEAERRGELRSAVAHWEAALLLDARILPAGQQSAYRAELESSLGDELFKLGEAAFNRGMHKDAFHFWMKGARIDTDNTALQQGLTKLEKYGDRILDEVKGKSNQACALVREILATTRRTSAVHARAKGRSQACDEGR